MRKLRYYITGSVSDFLPELWNFVTKDFGKIIRIGMN